MFGRLHGHRRGRPGRLGRPGAGVRQPVQPRRPLLQGRGGARARARRPAAALPDETGRRQVAAPRLGAGDQRGRRQDAADPPDRRTGLGLLAGLGQAQQRAVLPDPQVRVDVGHQQRRSSGADLSFDDGRGCRQHLGLRRDDQQLQRHPQLPRHSADRRQSGGSPSGFAAAHPARQGAEQRAADRLRSAVHPDGGARHRVCPPAARHRRAAGLGHHLAHPGERLGGQGLRGAAGLGPGADPRRSGEVAAGRGRERHRRAGSAGQADRPHPGREQAGHGDLVHGRHSAHHRQQQHPRLLHPATGGRQHGGGRRRHQHLPRPRQRPGRHRHGRRLRLPAGVLRPRHRRLEALGPGLGRRLRLDARPVRQQGHDGEEGHSGLPLDRRGARAEGQRRSAGEPEGDGVLGARAEFADARSRHEAGDGGFGPARRRRPVPDGHGGDERSHRRRLPVAGGDPVRDLRFGHRIEPLAAVAGKGDRTDVRIQARPRDHVPVRPQVRVREGAVQEHQGQRHRTADRGHPARDQPRLLDDRLHRPVAGAAAAAHAAPGDLRQDDAAGRTAALATANTMACRGPAGARRR